MSPTVRPYSRWLSRIPPRWNVRYYHPLIAVSPTSGIAACMTDLSNYVCMYRTVLYRFLENASNLPAIRSSATSVPCAPVAAPQHLPLRVYNRVSVLFVVWKLHARNHREQLLTPHCARLHKATAIRSPATSGPCAPVAAPWHLPFVLWRSFGANPFAVRCKKQSHTLNHDHAHLLWNLCVCV